MEFRRLRPDEAAVRHYVEELWLPYRRELESIVEGHALAADVDLVAAEVAYRLKRLAADGHRTWIAVDGLDADGSTDPVFRPDSDGDLAGFVTTDVDESPAVFDRPDRLTVGDLYVRESYRGTGLVDALLERAVERARAVGCEALSLEVDVDNERAIAVYERHGFETDRRRLSLTVEGD
ncbi:GNAT family N-acetyltransferase [Natronococcus roseus]|uniref:GNAT family N-acetyltransferase n=1 Tax=Natronococcus roseus TaxID=1052014 RepID=UPI00374CE47D